MDPQTALSELGRINLRETDLQGVLARVAELAKASLPGAAEVSVTLVRRGGASTAAFTDELALELDERQYQVGHGPCLDAAASQEILSIADMDAEQRWPEFAARAIERGIRSSLSVGMPVQETVTGALNIYGTTVDAFDEDQQVLAATFASYAAVALANASLYQAAATLNTTLEEAMRSRAVIEQAKGILMGQQPISPDEAFRILARRSQDTNRKLRDIAKELVQDAQRAGRGDGVEQRTSSHEAFEARAQQADFDQWEREGGAPLDQTSSEPERRSPED